MKRNMSLLTIMLTVFSILNVSAQDAPGTADKPNCKDYPGLSRYKGAVIHACSTINYGQFFLGLDEPVKKDFANHGQFFKKFMEVKGKINNIQYLLPLETNILSVYENYKNTLTKAGYSNLYTENFKNTCFYREDYYGGDAGAIVNGVDDFYGNKCDKNYYYTVYSGVKDSLNIYVALFIGQSGDEVIINQSVIEAVPLELGLVSAENIAQNIEFIGHSIFYDIHFASGSAEIDTKSDTQIKNIAAYLISHPDKKYFIVGHTDNTGEFAVNKKLSENRAKAVMNALVTKYAVNADQLKAYGVANLSPVTSNKTDGGKARNRRVEIVEQ